MNNENNDFLEKGGYNELLKKSIVFFNNLPIEKQNTYVEIFEFTPNMLLNKNMTGGGHKHKTNQYLLLIALQYYYLKEYYDLQKKNDANYVEKLQNIFSVKIDDDKIEKIKREKRRIDIAKNIENNLKVEFERKKKEFEEVKTKFRGEYTEYEEITLSVGGSEELQNIFERIKKYEIELKKLSKIINLIKTVIEKKNSDDAVKLIENHGDIFEKKKQKISKNQSSSTSVSNLTEFNDNSDSTGNNETIKIKDSKVVTKNKNNEDEKKIIEYITKYIENIEKHKNEEIKKLKTEEENKKKEEKEKQQKEKQQKLQQATNNQQRQSTTMKQQNQTNQSQQLTIQSKTDEQLTAIKLLWKIYNDPKNYNSKKYIFTANDEAKTEKFNHENQYEITEFIDYLFNTIYSVPSTSSIGYLEFINLTKADEYIKYIDTNNDNPIEATYNIYYNYSEEVDDKKEEEKNKDKINDLIINIHGNQYDYKFLVKTENEYNNISDIEYLDVNNVHKLIDEKATKKDKDNYKLLMQKYELIIKKEEKRISPMNLFIINIQLFNNTGERIKKKIELNEIKTIQIGEEQLLLTGVIFHIGEDNSGHFVTYILKKDKDKDNYTWFFINDADFGESNYYTELNDKLIKKHNNDYTYKPIFLFYVKDKKDINDNQLLKLKNLGNTCYRNVIYQNLFNFKPFVDYLETENNQLGTVITYDDNNEEKTNLSTSSINSKNHYKKSYEDAKQRINSLTYKKINLKRYTNIKNNIYYSKGGLLLELFDENTIIVDPAGIAFDGSNTYNGGELSGAIYKLFDVLDEYGTNAKKHKFGRIETTQNLFNTEILNKNEKTKNIIGVIHAIGPDQRIINDKKQYFDLLQKTLENIKENMKIFDNFKGVLRLPLISGGIFRDNIELCEYFNEFIKLVLDIFKDVNYNVVVFTFKEDENKCFKNWFAKYQTPPTP